MNRPDGPLLSPRSGTVIPPPAGNTNPGWWTGGRNAGTGGGRGNGDPRNDSGADGRISDEVRAHDEVETLFFRLGVLWPVLFYLVTTLSLTLLPPLTFFGMSGRSFC